MITPNCRVCGKNDHVGCYREEAPQQTICVLCCDGFEHDDGETGHQFFYEPGEGHMCTYCGINRNDTLYDYHDDEY